VTNAALSEEIRWLRGFGWSAPRIAARLKCHVSTVEEHIVRGEPAGALFRIASGASREARLVYGRSVPQWRNRNVAP
jgi:hypothetical protein